ncbi:MAG: FAD-dependent monooxygenase, partial [Gemmatimonadota bacterium]
TLVVGAGPAGLTAAIELARRGRSVRIIEAKPERSQFSKALGVNPRTLELLEAAGVSERLLERGRRIPGVEVWSDEEKLFSIDFGEIDHRYNFMLSLPQSETEDILENRLSELGVQVERGLVLQRIDLLPEGVRVLLAGDTATESLVVPQVVGADGAHSTARRELHIGFPGDRMKGDWSLADVRLDMAPIDPVFVRLGRSALLFMLRIRDGVYRVASNRPDVLDRLPTDSRITEVLWSSDFTVSHRLAETFQVGRVFLAGDAAHLHSPLGARGMNMGIEDAAELVRLMDSGQTYLYSPGRHSNAREAIRGIKRRTNAVTSAGWIAQQFRERVLPQVMRSRRLRKRVLNDMLGLS